MGTADDIFKELRPCPVCGSMIRKMETSFDQEAYRLGYRRNVAEVKFICFSCGSVICIRGNGIKNIFKKFNEILRTEDSDRVEKEESENAQRSLGRKEGLMAMVEALATLNRFGPERTRKVLEQARITLSGFNIGIPGDEPENLENYLKQRGLWD